VPIVSAHFRFLLQHQHYVSDDIMTVQTSSLHLKNTSSLSILSLVLVRLVAAAAETEIAYKRGLELAKLYEAEALPSIRPRPRIFTRATLC